ncbi:saccharopine dehydrogenase NADP-binding domain-containing protein [Limibacter armeniacum]|uniref:saccharopine dehydrogenase family protein n=1 Tax=Limibacter armeniacum TaxID=466084 RepID=UPI002FE63B71
MKILLYGANGYTGRLICEQAAEAGQALVLASRNAEKIKPIAKHYGWEYRTADLNDPRALDFLLSEMTVVLHCAGPFKFTAKQMMEACIRNGVHYLDITGEIEVFELGKSLDQKAKAANVMVMSGVGFDVVPTDCTALYLKKQLPDATHLQLAFTSVGGAFSHGTAKTMVENLGEFGAIRKDGAITPVPMGYKGRWVDFGKKRLFVMTIPWGDVATAFYTTGIPNIETYMGVPEKAFNVIQKLRSLEFLWSNGLVKRILNWQIDNNLTGPDKEARAKSQSMVWGRVTNASGEEKEARLFTPDGYTLTAKTALLIAQKVLSGNFKAGYQTPAGVYGEDLILEIPNTVREG